jgi:hypothetical protein
MHIYRSRVAVNVCIIEAKLWIASRGHFRSLVVSHFLMRTSPWSNVFVSLIVSGVDCNCSCICSAVHHCFILPVNNPGGILSCLRVPLDVRMTRPASLRRTHVDWCYIRGKPKRRHKILKYTCASFWGREFWVQVCVWTIVELSVRKMMAGENVVCISSSVMYESMSDSDPCEDRSLMDTCTRLFVGFAHFVLYSHGACWKTATLGLDFAPTILKMRRIAHIIIKMQILNIILKLQISGPKFAPIILKMHEYWVNH